MQLPLTISYKKFKERLRAGPQQFRASELRQLKDGVLLDGRDYDCLTVSGGWIFGHVPPTGESDWIDSKKIYDALKARDRIVDPISPVGLPAGMPVGITEAEKTKDKIKAKVQKSPQRTAVKTRGKKLKIRRVRPANRAGRRSAAAADKKRREPSLRKMRRKN